MPRYDFLCPECGNRTEVIKTMRESSEPVFCEVCADYEDATEMNRDFQAEGVLVGAGRRSYSKPIVSDSLAILPEQIPEHRRMFPNIPITKEGQPVFDNYTDHQKYLDTCGFVKETKTKKKRGKRIA